MILKSFGCSFIFGTDLADNDQHLSPPKASGLTWPAHLARHLNYDYVCCARPGAGNLQIAERVLSHLAEDCPDFVVIGWTWIDRFDFVNTKIKHHPVNNQWSNWKTIVPLDDTELARVYYKDLHSEYRDKLTSLMSIKLVIDTLQQKQVPFVMTYIDNLMFDPRWNHTPAVLSLQKNVKPYMTDFDGMTFLQWSQQLNFAMSQNLHPLEAAHQEAANIVIKVFDKQNTVVPAQQALF